MNAIEANRLTKYYGSLAAVDQVSFTVDEGEIFGFLGPNGAGKTTTMRMLTGVIRPDEGTGSIMGYDVVKENIRAKQARGVVPDTSNAYVDISAWQNLLLTGDLYGVPRRLTEERAEKLLRRFGLYEKRDQVVKGYSKGMKQRLILCMALVSEPPILFLDEPTSGLDVESSRLIKDIVREVNKGGVTVFLTTHNMEEANQLCDRIAIIRSGRIVAVDSPEKLKARSKELQSIEVSFDRPIDLAGVPLSGIAKTVKAGDKYRLYTGDPDTVIKQLVDYAESERLRIVALSLLSPSLEDVFVELTKKEA
ncbi:ABC transporter ATP binding subunit [Methanocella paludicola SANAE]|uniref:ABC transporter ATP binding subunit n=1 Tax=Methanocella paludicola (strain DSM 17711 / JCM 13418 / NBRC 101707 / SANAE) TaxID=304371 RepID=D1YWD5_METPS|nr:daunorubicin resistance protein DrrA family ABC transporter ATP-binding protein [Methanocella paludicola]BAI60757.1 ABC transporter ATP binding subunit [Methanocella paludicola SANAE]